MTPTEINEVVQAICKVAIERTGSPVEGMHVLCAACYAFWAQNKNKAFDYESWLDQVVDIFDELHGMNTPQGTA